jgi:hypothetical protein
MAHSAHTFVTLGRVSNGNPAIRGHTHQKTLALQRQPAIKTVALLSQLTAQFNNLHFSAQAPLQKGDCVENNTFEF